MLGLPLLRRTLLLLLILSFGSSVSADVLDDILERGTIRVGVAEFVPWTLRNEAGDLIGFEIDVAEKIAGDMNIKPEFKAYLWENLIPALENGEIDIIAAGMAITPGRALRVNFSRPLANSGTGLATNTLMTKDFETLEQLNDPDVVITAVTETFGADVGRILFSTAKLQLYATRALAEKEIIEGRAHAYLASLAEIRFLTLKHGEVIDMPIAEPLVANSEALAVHKGEQELLNFLNAWVTARQADKWLPTTHDYWFGTLNWAQGAAE